VKWPAGLLALVLIAGVLSVGLFKVEKTCRTVQADAQDDWFGPDQRREQTTCEWKVVSRL
jgi:hypothetical protein